MVAEVSTRRSWPAGGFSLVLLVTLGFAQDALSQTAFTWQQIKDKFEAANPTLKAARLNIDESKAAEITEDSGEGER